jgi:hypothetical protein
MIPVKITSASQVLFVVVGEGLLRVFASPPIIAINRMR